MTSPPPADISLSARLAAYFELTKPGIAAYVMLTAGASAYVGARGAPDVGVIVNVMGGLGLASAGALALNQYVERREDAVMTRTRDRPIPTGRIGPRTGAAFGTALLVAGVAWLALASGPIPAALAAFSAIVYHGAYRPLKSRSFMATFVGAVPGALPMLIGWTASTASIDWGGGALLLIGYLWQLPHVLGLAWMLRDDYAKVGFRLIPEGGADVIGPQLVTATALLIPASLLPYGLGLAGSIYLAGASVLGLAFLARAFISARNLTTANARRVFTGSLMYHPLLLLLIVLDTTPAKPPEREITISPEAQAPVVPAAEGQGFAMAALRPATPVPLVANQTARPRARDLGLVVGIFDPGPHNAITDVEGVRVGHATVSDSDRVNTGVTAIIPHGDNLFRSRVPAAIHVGNGFGKLLGVTQVRELGEIETPILLTCTLCVWKAADAMVEWMLAHEGMGEVRSINPVVGETNDGALNDIRSRPIAREHVVEALESASGGYVEEGAVGAGTGTVAFGWKGGIGTSSRILPEGLGGYTVGVVVQSNFGGILTMNGAPVGVELGHHSFSRQVREGRDRQAPVSQRGFSGSATSPGRAGRAASEGPVDTGGSGSGPGDGSVMIVVATDAPLSDRNLGRLARRAIMGLARTGSFASNGSGDYVIAFSTAEEVRRNGGAELTHTELDNSRTSALFLGVVEATEEAIYNSILRANTTTGNGRTVPALPLDETLDILRRYGAVR